MATKAELKSRNRLLKRRIADDRATFDDRLADAFSEVVRLHEDNAWLREVADGRQERIEALQAQLFASRLQLEALRRSGRRSPRRVAAIVFHLVTGLGAIAELSGITVSELLDDGGGACEFVCHLSQEHLHELRHRSPDRKVQVEASLSATLETTGDVNVGARAVQHERTINDTLNVTDEAEADATQHNGYLGTDSVPTPTAHYDTKDIGVDPPQAGAGQTVELGLVETKDEVLPLAAISEDEKQEGRYPQTYTHDPYSDGTD